MRLRKAVLLAAALRKAAYIHQWKGRQWREKVLATRRNPRHLAQLKATGQWKLEGGRNSVSGGRTTKNTQGL